MQSIAADVIAPLAIPAPPVDVEMVASSLGIGAVLVDNQLPVAGCLVQQTDESFQIRLRGTDGLGRQRFTVCHECAHTFLPGFASRTQYRCSPEVHPGAGPDVESLCDLTASHLLFPSTLFMPDARTMPFGFDALRDLADRYKASLEATGHRLVEVTSRQLALLVLTLRQKPAEKGTQKPPRLRLDYALRVGDWPYFMRHKSAAPGGVLDRALHGEAVSETTTLTDICHTPVRAEVQARLCPFAADGVVQQRVIALARPIGQ